MEKKRRRALEHIHRLTLMEEMENRAELNIRTCVCVCVRASACVQRERGRGQMNSDIQMGTDRQQCPFYVSGAETTAKKQIEYTPLILQRDPLPFYLFLPPSHPFSFPQATANPLLHTPK